MVCRRIEGCGRPTGVAAGRFGPALLAYDANSVVVKPGAVNHPGFMHPSLRVTNELVVTDLTQIRG